MTSGQLVPTCNVFCVLTSLWALLLTAIDMFLFGTLIFTHEMKGDNLNLKIMKLISVDNVINKRLMFRYLHNETMFAVAQKKYLYIYDNNGIEIHCVRRQMDINRLDFLPYHFLLVSVVREINSPAIESRDQAVFALQNDHGELKYQDVSTGSFVAEYKTKKGPCDVMVHNPYNAIVLLGHHNGSRVQFIV